MIEHGPDDSKDPSKIRRRALLRRLKASFECPDETDAMRLLHELHVHQLELEMQNEALRNAGARSEAAIDQLTKLNAQLEKRLGQRTAELLAARNAAQAADQAKACFLGNVSHEIRTPMNGILGMAHLLRRSGLNPAQGELLEHIDSAGRHLLGVIDDILDFSRICAGNLQLINADFRLETLIQETLARVGSGAAAKGLELSVDLAGMPERLHGDSQRLGQALFNYLTNAVKFTSRGKVSLAGSVVEETGADYLLRFEVADTGVGIAPAQLVRIFEPFTQADGSMTRPFGGTGLGLAITRRLVRLMGGETGVSSTLGEGSCFWLTVRLKKGRADESPAPTPAD